MQRFASILLGAMNASVGQTSRQARQLPQWSRCGFIDRQGQVGEKLAEENQEPLCLFNQHRVLADPAQPDFSASARSRTGALSTNAR